MTSQSFEPAVGKLLIRPADPEEVSDGGIILPAQAQEATQAADIIEISVGHFEQGTLVRTAYVPGDRILFAKYAGTEVEIAGETLKVIGFADILGRVVAES
jgi:chaperonin GroES